MTWAAFLAGVVALVAVTAVPGVLLARLVGFSWFTAAFLSLPVGTGLLAVVAGVNAFVPIPWTWGQPTILVVLLLIALWVRRGRAPSHQLPALSGVQLALVAAGVAASAFHMLHSFYTHAPSPASMPLYGDGHFHLQALQQVAATGQANPIGALGAIYDPINPPTDLYYPHFWHLLMSLPAALVGPVIASNAGVALVGGVMWPVGLMMLAWAVMPKADFSLLAVGLLAPLPAIFPTVILVGFAMYPYALSIVLMPAAVALVCWAVRTGARQMWLMAAAVTVGIGLSQPATLLLLLVALYLLALGKVLGSVPAWWKSGYKVGVVAWPTVLIVPVAAGLIIAPRTAFVQGLAQFERPSLGYRQALLDAWDGAMVTTAQWWPWPVILSVAILAAVVLSVRNVAARALFLTGVAYFGLYLAAAGPENLLRVYVSPFYKDFHRLTVPVILVVLVFASLGVGLVTDWALKALARKPALYAVVGTIPLAALSIVPYKAEEGKIPRLRGNYFELAYEIDEETTGRLDAHEVELLEELAGEDTAGQTILGQPAAGTAWASLVADVTPYMPLEFPFSDDQKYLANHFFEIHTDPEVCRIVREGNIRYFIDIPYSDEELQGEVTDGRTFEGLMEVPTETGFILIDQRGETKLWEITACD